MPDQETEIGLGIGKLLGMFLGLAVLCGVFFVAGYSMGKNAAPANAPLTEAMVPPSVPGAKGTKPAAAQVVGAKADCWQSPQGCAPAEGNNSAATSAGINPGAIRASGPMGSSKASEIQSPAVPDDGTYVVQVAALSKQQDAEALVAALRQKQYAVFIGNRTTDNLFHVQIGPFHDAKEADSVRARLIGDGYSPIVKK